MTVRSRERLEPGRHSRRVDTPAPLHSAGPRPIQKHLDRLDLAFLRELLLRCGDGDVEAFDQFYELTSPVCATLIAAQNLPAAKADSTLVQLYVTIWCRAPTFAASGQSVWQWTLTILTDALPTRAARRPTALGQQPPPT